MEQQQQSQNKPNTFASSFRRLFQRNGSIRGRNNAAGESGNKSSHKTSSRSSTMTRRSKSTKDTSTSSKRNLEPDFALKSTTLPSPIRPSALPTLSPSPSPPHKLNHQYHNIPPSPTGRARQHTHLPITIMKSPLSAPPINPHYTLPRQPPPLRQTNSSWDISSTALNPATLSKRPKKLTRLTPSSPPHYFGDKASIVPANGGGLPTSSSVIDINHHTYSEPYHWLSPPSFTAITPGTVASSRNLLELPPPPLPPRPHQVHPEPKGLTTHDYMSISTLTLNPKPDVSDYQQPIVTQTTPLPSCIKHRQQTIRDELQKEFSPEENKEEDKESNLQQKPTNAIIQRREKSGNTPFFSHQSHQCRADTRRTTVVILNDDRTLKV